MMRFQNFETLYGAACDILKAAGDNQVVVTAVKKQKEVLLAQLSANFPSSLRDCEMHPGFDIFQFLDMLVRFPEVVRLNKMKFCHLIDDLEQRDVEIPSVLRKKKGFFNKEKVEMSSEEQKIDAVLKNSFPDSYEKLLAIPFESKRLFSFMDKYPDVLDGNRRQFLDLMADMSRKGLQIPEALVNQWRSFVMQP